MDMAMDDQLSADAIETIATRLRHDLRDAIVRLDLKPGDKISESDIALHYGVSRQPVREAFIRLAQSGLLLVRPKRATRVVQISEKLVLQARFIREAMEVEIVRRAAERITPDQVGELVALIARQQVAADADDFVAFHGLDELFHRKIARISDVEFAWELIDDQKMQLDRVRFLTLPGATPQTISEHIAIVDAIAAHDAGLAVHRMRAHLSKIEPLLVRAKAEWPGYFG